MLQTPQIPIRKGILNHLKKLQDEIDALPTYKEQVQQAKVLWQTKKKSNAQKSAFNRIEKALQKISIGTQHACNYCEANKGTNIEHIYPKGFFPNKTFVWENYLWTCKSCNGAHKISQFQIFESPQSSKVRNLFADKRFAPPLNEDAVFINPRTENPLDFIRLDLETGLFHPISTDKNTRAYIRAIYTIETLQLNARKNLVTARQQAYLDYQHALKTYIKAGSLEENPLCLQTQKQIVTALHPTVWKEIQSQATTIPTLKILFAQAPEALYW